MDMFETKEPLYLHFKNFFLIMRACSPLSSPLTKLLASLILRIFFPLFNIGLYDKNSESDYFFFLHQNQNIFFSNIGNHNIFLEKKHTPPPLLYTITGLNRVEEKK
jgi:hypothetical protein